MAEWASCAEPDSRNSIGKSRSSSSPAASRTTPDRLHLALALERSAASADAVDEQIEAAFSTIATLPDDAWGRAYANSVRGAILVDRNPALAESLLLVSTGQAPAVER